MRVVFDTSALAKRYVAENATARVLEICIEAREIIVSVLGIVEMFSALSRLRREERLPPDEYAAVKQRLIADMTQATVVQLTSAVLSRAIEVLESTSLRTLDAIHLATALDASCDLFVSADAHQCKAAAAMGLKIEQIG